LYVWQGLRKQSKPHNGRNGTIEAVRRNLCVYLFFVHVYVYVYVFVCMAWTSEASTQNTEH
jgi:hypothetical protein